MGDENTVEKTETHTDETKTVEQPEQSETAESNEGSGGE